MKRVGMLSYMKSFTGQCRGGAVAAVVVAIGAVVVTAGVIVILVDSVAVVDCALCAVLLQILRKVL